MRSLHLARLKFCALALGTIVVGLAVHWYGTVFSPTLRDILGDALWAMMIVWLIGALVPSRPIAVRAGLALVICWMVEASQAYHSQFLDSLRQTTIGALVLGTGFDLRDFASYALGVATAAGLELVGRRSGR